MASQHFFISTGITANSTGQRKASGNVRSPPESGAIVGSGACPGAGCSKVSNRSAKAPAISAIPLITYISVSIQKWY